jgi:predicted ribonuclease YlaK
MAEPVSAAHPEKLSRVASTADETLPQITTEGRLSMESVTYLPGRSPHGAWAAGRAQNLEPTCAATSA